MKGSYSLIIKTPEKPVEVGALGKIKFEKDYAVYNGSAFGTGGLKRVFRHFNPGSTHWHIDYLLEKGVLKAALVFPEKDLECSLSNKIEGSSVEGFGCSDCSCKSHLFTFDSFEDTLAVADLVSHVKIIDRHRYSEYENSVDSKSIENIIEELPSPESYKQSCQIG